MALQILCLELIVLTISGLIGFANQQFVDISKISFSELFLLFWCCAIIILIIKIIFHIVEYNFAKIILEIIIIIICMEFGHVIGLIINRELLVFIMSIGIGSVIGVTIQNYFQSYILFIISIICCISIYIFSHNIYCSLVPLYVSKS